MHDTPPGGQAADHEDAPIQKTGTTTVAVKTEDAVVLGADRRASLGGRFVSNKQAEKILEVHPTAAITIAGSVGGAQSFASSLRAEANLYETRRGKPPSMQALSTLAGNLLQSMPLPVSPLLGGVDDEGPALFSLDAAGGVMTDDYGATGSGMQLAYGVLERQYEDGLTVEAAREVVADAVESASERDTASGNGLTLATVTSEGVEMDTAADPAEVL
jgi:proteasome beta subunit